MKTFKTLALGAAMACMLQDTHAKKKEGIDNIPIDFSLFDKLLAESPNGHNFTMERHTITTEDGYILNLMRLVANDQSSLGGKPALLMHGLT